MSVLLTERFRKGTEIELHWTLALRLSGRPISNEELVSDETYNNALGNFMQRLARTADRSSSHDVLSEAMDTLTPEQRSERMSRVRGRDTKPEMIVRRLVHGMGYRYRFHRRDLPGSPDLVFFGPKLVIFVQGCFWHRHADPNCPLARLPKSKLDFWGPKLETNRKRDECNLALLSDLGWGVLEIWECQTKNREEMQVRIGEFLA